jgi:hypothetical protein
MLDSLGSSMLSVEIVLKYIYLSRPLGSIKGEDDE